MSISTPAGDQRRPSVASTGKKSPSGAKPTSGGKGAGTGKKSPSGAKPTSGGKGAGNAKNSAGAKGAAGGKAAGKSVNRPSAAGAGGGPRKPIQPVKVTQGRNWGPIALFAAVGVIAVGIIGYGGWAVYQGGQPWEERAAAIEGILNFRKSDPELTAQREHRPGPQPYTVTPPVAGNHNSYWQNCNGDVYDAPIANEHAVHSLEHGAIWITYRTGLPADQVEKLADRVRGTDYMLMSPVDNLDSPISLQAWGYQLKVDNADDGRIDEFIKTLRIHANMEPGATCSQGITATGTTPRDLEGGM